jgi:hypothetical protein
MWNFIKKCCGGCLKILVGLLAVQTARADQIVGKGAGVLYVGNSTGIDVTYDMQCCSTYPQRICEPVAKDKTVHATRNHLTVIEYPKFFSTKTCEVKLTRVDIPEKKLSANVTGIEGFSGFKIEDVDKSVMISDFFTFKPQ